MPPEIIALTRQIRALWHRFDWLPEWAVTSLVLLVFVGGGWLTHKIAFAILRRMVRKKDVFWRGVVERARIKLRVLIIIMGVGLGVTVSPMHPEPSADVRSVLLFLFILTLGWLASGVLSRLDRCFSRDEGDGRYVQDLVASAADELRAWVARGAAIYVCGSLEGMSQGVHAALESALGADVVLTMLEDGRYRRDVY